MMNTDSYDEIPYDSTPFADTHPDHLCVLGRLFGLETPTPQTARILELGCATGGNIIPLASHLPDARVVGIELSVQQVATAQQLIQRLGLNNIEILQRDIMELGEELGQFDYIIAHGVYSWVPQAVRTRILHLCHKLLSPHGVAYISYNTLPGWRMRGTLRDMLLHHTRNSQSPSERLALAYQLFDLLEQALHHDETPASRYLRNEIAGLRKSHPSYLYHEYLEEINQPFLFSDFVAEARVHQLAYLCDVELANDIPSTLGQEASLALDHLEDLIEQGQYADFVSNRTFRRSLLCHAGAPLQRELSLEQLTAFAYRARLLPERKGSLKHPASLGYLSDSGLRFEVEHPLTKAALTYLAVHYPDAVAFEELQQAARQEVSAAGGTKYLEDSDILLSELLALFAHQGLRLLPQPHNLGHTLDEKPRMNSLARAQLELQLGHLATASHTTLSLDPFSTALLRLLDGTHTLAELCLHLTAQIKAGELTIEHSDKRPSQEKIEATIRVNVERLLTLFAREGIFETGA